MPPVMFSVVTKYHKGRHSLFLYNSEIFYAFTQDILRSLINCGLSYLFDDSDWLWNFAEAIYFGLMFNTWYYNQLIRNGYHENHQHESLEFE